MTRFFVPVCWAHFARQMLACLLLLLLSSLQKSCSCGKATNAFLRAGAKTVPRSQNLISYKVLRIASSMGNRCWFFSGPFGHMST